MDPRKLMACAAAVAIGPMIGCASPSRPHVEAAGSSVQDARLAGVQEQAPIAFRDAERTLERADRALDEGDDAEARHLADLTEERVDVARSIAEEKRLRDQSETLVDRTTDRVIAARTQEAADARRQSEALLRELHALQAREEERGLVLTLGDILFEVDGATLQPGADPHLERLAQFLRENPDRSVLIEGHTDDTGSDRYNRMLSEERAEAVAERLVQLGVERSRLRTAALGESRPIASNENPGGRQENRRVEVVITPPLPSGG